MSLITLGLGIDTSGLARAKTDMQALVPAAKDVQTAAEGAANAVNKIKPAVDGTANAVTKIKPAVEGAATAVNKITPAAEGAATAVNKIKPAVEGVAAAIGKAAPATQGLKTATDGLAASVEKTNGVFVTQQQRVKQLVAETQRHVQSTEQMAAGTGLARHELINLSRQLQDVGVSLIGGQSLFTVFAQQGTQIADIYGSSRTGTVGGSIKQLGGIISSLVTPMRLLGLGVAAVGAAAFAGIASWKSFTLQLDDAARAAGTTTASMSQLQAAASIKGISADDFSKGMQSFASSVYDAKNGMGELAQVFRVNGVHASNFDDAMEKAADLIKRAGNDQQRLQLLQQMGLPATMEWVRLLSGGAAGLKAAKDAMAAFSANDDLVKKAREFDEAWNKAWANFGLNARSAFQTALEFGSTFFDKMEKLAAQAGNASFWNKFVPPNMKPEDFGLQSLGGDDLANGRVSSGFDAALDAPANPALQSALQKRVRNSDMTVDPNVLQHNLQIEQQRLALLGQTATALDAVRSVELQVQQARANGVPISEKQVDVLKRLAYENALGITQTKAQTDAYDIQTKTIGMSVGAATAYAVAQNAINEANRNGRALSESDVAAIKAQAAALGQAAQAAAEAQASNRALFDLQSAGLSGVEMQIARVNKQIHGDHWKEYGDSALANLMRVADAQKQVNDAVRDFGSDLLSSLQQGKSVFDGLQKAAESFANRLANIGLDKLFNGLKNGTISFDLGSIGDTIGKSASHGIVQGFDTIQANAAAARSNPANSFSFNGMGGMATRGVAAAGVGLGIYSQGQQAGASGGSVEGSGLSGALTGALAGATIGGPIGAVIGGIGGAIAGLFGASSGQSQAAKKAKEDWEAAKGAAESFGNQLASGARGSLTSSLTDAKAQVEQFSLAAFKGKDRDAAHVLAQQYDQFVLRTSKSFQDSFGGIVDALNSGLGPNSPFANGAANVKDLGDQLKGFIQDTQTAVGHLTGGDAQAQAVAVAQAAAGAQKYALSLLGQAPVLTEVQSAIQHLNGTAAQLGTTLVQLGMSSADAAAAIQAGVLASMKQLADTFTNGIQREINAANGQDYKNSLADLVAKFQSNLADAAALGLNSDLVNQWFKVSAQKIVTDAGLAGDAVAELVQQFPQLAGVVTGVAAAVEDAHAVLEATTQTLLAIYNEATANVDSARQNLTAAYQAESSALQSTIDKTKSWVTSLKEFSNSLKLNPSLSVLSPQDQYLAAQAQARATATLAQSGDADAQARLQGDLSAYLDQSKSFNASTEAYYRDFQDVQNILARSQAAGNRQVSVAQQQLDTLNQQVSGLIAINDSVLTVAAAVAALKDALAVQKQAARDLQPAAAASGNVEALYKSILGRSPDAAGKAYWEKQIANGMSGTDLERSFVGGAIAAGQRNQVDPMLLAKYRLQNGGIVGAYAQGGIVGNGIFGVDSVIASYAGGGNIALAGGEYVMPADQTARNRSQLDTMRAGRTNDNGDWKSVARALRQGNSADTDRLLAKFDEFIDVLNEAPEKNKAAFRQLIGQSKQRAS